jgi:hypothetical protein
MNLKKILDFKGIVMAFFILCLVSMASAQPSTDNAQRMFSSQMIFGSDSSALNDTIAAISDNDFSAWQSLIEEQLTEENFAAIVESFNKTDFNNNNGFDRNFNPDNMTKPENMTGPENFTGNGQGMPSQGQNMQGQDRGRNGTPLKAQNDQNMQIQGASPDNSFSDNIFIANQSIINEITTSIIDNDFSTWQSLIEAQLTEENFNKLVEMSNKTHVDQDKNITAQDAIQQEHGMSTPGNDTKPDMNASQNHNSFNGNGLQDSKPVGFFGRLWRGIFGSRK